MADLRSQIQKSNDELTRLFKAKDAKGISEMFTEDCITMFNGKETLSGKENVIKGTQEYYNEGSVEIDVTILSITASGDLAAETGKVDFINKEGAVTTLRYMTVRKKEGDKWKHHYVMKNSNQ